MRYPATKADKNMAADIFNGISENELSKITAPRTAGTLIMKDKVKERSCLTFLMRRTVIVVPDLDIPGSMARP